LFVVDLYEFVALGKTTLAKKLSFYILAESDFAVLVFYFFFNDLLAGILLTVEVRLTTGMLAS
jgi:hypothetical protein